MADKVRRRDTILGTSASVVAILTFLISPDVRHATADVFQWCVQHPWIPAIAILGLLVVFLFYRVHALKRQLRRSELVRPVDPDQAGKLEGLIEVVPQAAFLSSWLSNTVFAKTDRPVLGLNGSLRLDVIRRDFQVKGADVLTKDLYEGRGQSDSEVRGLRFVTLAGNVKPADFDAEACQMLDGADKKLPLSIETEEERLTIFRADFVVPLRQGDSFQVRYQDFWSGSMRYGFDGLFYTSIISFRSVRRLESTLTFDSRVDYARGFWYDLDSGHGAATDPQPEQIEVTANKSQYRWCLDRPSVHNLYFVIVERDSPQRSVSRNVDTGNETPAAPVKVG